MYSSHEGSAVFLLALLAGLQVKKKKKKKECDHAPRLRVPSGHLAAVVSSCCSSTPPPRSSSV